MNTDYRKIPPQLATFSQRNGLAESSGPGFDRRKKFADLIESTTHQVKAYLREGESLVTTLMACRIKAVLRITGDLPAAESFEDRFAFALGLAVTDGEKVAQTLDIESKNACGRILAGEWRLTPEKRDRLEAHLDSLADDISTMTSMWASEMRDVGIQFLEAPAGNGAGHPPLVAERLPEDGPPLSMKEFIGIVASTIVGLKPMLEKLLETGRAEDFRELRRLTAEGPAGNTVFTVKNLLGHLTSAKAREISHTSQK